jgi:hypothetical protein
MSALAVAVNSLLLRVSRLAGEHSEQQRQTATRCMPCQVGPTRGSSQQKLAVEGISQRL